MNDRPWRHDGGPDDSVNNMGAFRLPDFATAHEKEHFSNEVFRLARDMVVAGSNVDDAFLQAIIFYSRALEFAANMRQRTPSGFPMEEAWRKAAIP